MSTFQVPTRNCQPFRSSSALGSSFTQPCTLAQDCAVFQLGFPTSCLRRHVGAPRGDNQMLHHCSSSSGFYWSKVKITKADTPTIQTDCHPILTNWCPNLYHPHHFTPDALPGATLPIYPGLGQAPNILACIPSGYNIHNNKLANATELADLGVTVIPICILISISIKW